MQLGHYADAQVRAGDQRNWLARLDGCSVKLYGATKLYRNVRCSQFVPDRGRNDATSRGNAMRASCAYVTVFLDSFAHRAGHDSVNKKPAGNALFNAIRFTLPGVSSEFTSCRTEDVI